MAALVLPMIGSAQEAPPPSAEAPATAPEAPPLLTLERGDSGPAVRDLQRALVRRGHDLPVDGEYGPRTEAVVRAAQKRLGQEPTGTADPAFLAAIGLELREPPAPAACDVADAASADEPSGRWLRVFPLVGEYTYTAGFGAARHQGEHEGVDIIADRGTPTVAVADASVLRLSRSERGLGGIWIWLRDGSGTEYYYAHLDAIVGGLSEGERVTAGQRIGTVGNTGDARYGAPHLHFEVHPRGGPAVDPYKDLRTVDPGSGTRAVSADGCTTDGPARPAGDDADRVSLSVAQLRINQRIAQTAVRRVNTLESRLIGAARPAPRKAEGGRRITLSRGQLLINQRISQVALVRARAIEDRLEGRRGAARDDARAGDRVTLSRRQLLINQRVSQAAVRTTNDLRERVESARATRAVPPTP